MKIRNFFSTAKFITATILGGGGYLVFDTYTSANIIADQIIERYEKNRQILLSKPHGKATVGTVLTYDKGNETFIFLGREDINGASAEKAGKYSDLGGRVEENDKTYIAALLRELKEESRGYLDFDEDYVLKNSHLVSKINNGRTIYYIMLNPCSGIMLKINHLINHTRNNPRPQDYEEKDDYNWFKLEDILQQLDRKSKIDVIDMEGEKQHIEIRPYLITDFFKNPQFALARKEIENQAPSNFFATLITRQRLANRNMDIKTGIEK